MPSYAVAIIIAVIAAQYALALFCLLKLAYLDISKKQYVLWNLFILIVFFIGAAVFLVYYRKVKDEKRITPYVEEQEPQEQAGEENSAADGEEKPEATATAADADKPEESETPRDGETTVEAKEPEAQSENADTAQDRQ